jgi:uncharacterized RDD family membrane protein YckC
MIILAGVFILFILGLFSLSLSDYITALLLSYLLMIVYFTLFEGSSGQTIGKKLLGIKVTMPNGRAPGHAIAFIRTIFRAIDCLPALYVLGMFCIYVSSQDQRLGDMAAGTIVVKV